VFSTQTLAVLEKAGIPDFTSPGTYPLHVGNFGAYAALPYGYRADGMIDTGQPLVPDPLRSVR
jgi:hypothetical protein